MASFHRSSYLEIHHATYGSSVRSNRPTKQEVEAMKPSQKNRITCCSRIALALVGLLLWPGFVGAQQPYYQGKSLNLLVDFSAGGPTDLECRIYGT
jgi:hypothetical protein